jgi:hypothetical protein
MKGYIQAQIQTGGGKNQFGELVPAEISWGSKKECRYHANVLNNRGKYEDGKFTQSAYIITLFDMDVEASIIRLFNSKDNLICEKEVQSLEILEDVQRVKITV